MHNRTDREYILGSQYKDASALNARIQIHRFSTNKQGWFGWVLDHINLPLHCEILDLGCGPGGLWKSKANLIPDGWHLTLTDISSGMLEEAKSNLAEVPHPFEFAVVDAKEIPFGDAQFDAVIANHMLYHVPDRSRALSEIRRVLKPGGALYASTVGIGHMRELQEICSRIDTRIDLALDSVAKEFGLENGAPQLEQFFKDVKLHLYDDYLLVPEAKPVVDYLLSTSDCVPLLNEYGPDALTQAVEAELSRTGSIRISKKNGMFATTCMSE